MGGFRWAFSLKVEVVPGEADLGVAEREFAGLVAPDHHRRVGAQPQRWVRRAERDGGLLVFRGLRISRLAG